MIFLMLIKSRIIIYILCSWYLIYYKGDPVQIKKVINTPILPKYILPPEKKHFYYVNIKYSLSFDYYSILKRWYDIKDKPLLKPKAPQSPSYSLCWYILPGTVISANRRNFYHHSNRKYTQFTRLIIVRTHLSQNTH